MRYAIGSKCIRRLKKQTGLDIVYGLGRGGWEPWLTVWTRDGTIWDVRRRGRDAVEWAVQPPPRPYEPPDEPSLDELFFQQAQRNYFMTLSTERKEEWLGDRPI